MEAKKRKIREYFRKPYSVDSEIQNEDITLDKNLQKMILSRPVIALELVIL